MIETYPLEKVAEAYARIEERPRRVPRRADDVTTREVDSRFPV
jgi:hypothetical protein